MREEITSILILMDIYYIYTITIHITSRYPIYVHVPAGQAGPFDVGDGGEVMETPQDKTKVTN